MGTILVISEQEKKLVRVVPSERQMRHQKLEFYGFLHFTINTFTDREWGDGTESPSVFCLWDTEKIRENSQPSDESEFRQRTLSSSDQDLGSRAVLAGENDLVWYPTEVNFSIRPGWFYHESEDDQVRSLENLISIYDRSMGVNSTMLLNVPQTKEGLIHDRDAERLRELGAYLRRREAHNLVEEAEMTATGSESGVIKEDIGSARELKNTG